MNLNDRALMIQLNISQWTAKKRDKKASSEVTRANNAASGVARVNKTLLPGASELEQVHAMTSHVRDGYYTNTASCGIEGMQILASGNYLPYVSEFRRQKAEWYRLVDHFCNEYPRLKARAPHALQSLYDDKDYPAEADIRGKFNMDIKVFPIPEGRNLRIPISSAELDTLQQDIESRVDTAAKVAMRDVWSRLHEKVKHIAEKCADPSAIFRDSMVDNAKELCELLPRLNFMDDPQLETMRLDVERLLVNPDRLRTNPVLRRDTAAEAKRIMDAMSGIMGGV